MNVSAPVPTSVEFVEVDPVTISVPTAVTLTAAALARNPKADALVAVALASAPIVLRLFIGRMVK